MAREKILVESKAFPSDQYAIHSFLEHLGLNPSEILIEINSGSENMAMNNEDIVHAIEHHSNELALVFLGGINYYTGQLLDIQQISKASREAGAMVGFDLAHAMGNVNLSLHDWDLDFACWCSYKYLNGGPGAVAAVFVHEKHHLDKTLKRLAGWWGYEQSERFTMHNRFTPEPDATGWQLSTPSILLYACLQSSLDIFTQAGWTNILAKQEK